MGQVESGMAVNTCSRFGMTGAFSGCSGRRLCRWSFVASFSRIKLTRRRIPDHRIEPGDDIQSTAWMLASGYTPERWSNANQPTDYCEHCKDCQRHPHRRRRLVRRVRSMAMIIMPVCRYVMGNVFMNWSNVLAGLVSWTISG